MNIFALLLVVVLLLRLQGALYRKRAFDRLEYTCHLSKHEAMQGEEIELVEVVKNKKFLPIPWFKIELITSRWLSFADADSVITDQSRFVPSFFMLRSHHQVTRRWKVQCLKRGEFEIKRIIGMCGDLFGANSVSKGFEVNAQVVVLPKPLDLSPFLTQPLYYGGETALRRYILEDPFYIAGVRQYSQRDALNRVNWMATARTQTMMVHQNESTTRQSVTVLLNMQTGEFERGTSARVEALERSIRVCASIFEQTQQTDTPFRFMTNTALGADGEEVVTGEFWGQEHIQDCMRLLAALDLKSSRTFGEYLEEYFSHIQSTDVIVVTTYPAQEILEFARGKRLEGIHVRIFVTSGVDRENLPDDCEIDCLYDEVNGE